MQYMTISRVSRDYEVSTRTLRYYEELGLIKSSRREDYAYRVYDEEAVSRLRQILLLRRLRIPLRQIAELLRDQDTASAIAVFQENIARLNCEIHALETIRHATALLCARIEQHTGTLLRLDLLTEQDLRGIADFSSFSNLHFREEPTMDELTRANNHLTRFENTRLIYIAPATVASSHSIGAEPEDTAGEAINRFIVAERLFERKPDYRLFGFNNPTPTPGDEFHGYEFWVTIPDDMEVPAPLTKKHMEGGLYAAHCIKMGDFEEWQHFWHWVHHNDVCTYEEREPLGMAGSLEEHLNAPGTYRNVSLEDVRNVEFKQLDLLIPVRLL